MVNTEPITLNYTIQLAEFYMAIGTEGGLAQKGTKPDGL